MKADPRGLMLRIMNHIGHTVDTEKLDKLVEATEFKNFQAKSGMNTNERHREGKGQFIRKGIVGDWVNYFSVEKAREWQNWTEQNLETIGISTEEYCGAISK